MARVKRWFNPMVYAGADVLHLPERGLSGDQADQTMSFVVSLLAPLALLLPAAGALDAGREADESTMAETPANRLSLPDQPAMPAFDPAENLVFERLSQSFEVPVENQVRIEQRVTIRISPRAAPPPPTLLVDLPARAPDRRAIERNIGRCLPIARIAGVQVSGDDRLMLFMRDRRIVSAALERGCRARDFYSGFYVERNADGLMCVKRDALRSRSGATCRLAQIRQVIDADE